MRRARFVALLCGGLVLLALAAYVLWSRGLASPAGDAVQAGALAFVESEPRIVLLAGGPVQARPVEGDAAGDRIEFVVGPYHVLVDALRDGSQVGYRIACVTTRGPEERDPDVDACLQSPVRLPNAVS